MNILEASRKAGVSASTLRKIKKAGIDVLKLDDPHSDVAHIRRSLAAGNSLSVPHMLEILEDPSILDMLGTYRLRAQKEIAALGNVAAEAAPIEIFSAISEASDGDPESVAIIVNWIKATVPDTWVSHAWIGVRLLLNSHSRHIYARGKLTRVLLYCRDHLEGWTRTDIQGRRAKTFYRKPQRPVANLDL